MDKEQLVERLRRHKPKGVKVFLTDGSERDLEVPHKVQRFEIIAETMGGLPWERAEFYGPTGLCGSCSADEDETDASSAAERVPASRRDPDLATPEGQMFNRYMKLTQMAMREMKAIYSDVIDGYQTLTQVFGNRLAALEMKYGEILALAHHSTVALAQAQALAKSGGVADDPDAQNKAMENKILEKLVDFGFGQFAKQAGVDLSNLDPTKLQAFLSSFAKDGANGGAAAGEAEAAEETAEASE